MKHEKARPDGGEYVEASPFVRLLATKGRVKILDVFLGKHYTKLTVSRITKLAGIDKSTFHRNVDTLLEMDVVGKSDEEGKTYYYLNKDNELAEKLREVQLECLKYSEETTEFPQFPDRNTIIEYVLEKSQESPQEESSEQSPTNTSTKSVAREAMG